MHPCKWWQQTRVGSNLGTPSRCLSLVYEVLVNWHNIRLPSGTNEFDSRIPLLSLCSSMVEQVFCKHSMRVRFLLLAHKCWLGRLGMRLSVEQMAEWSKVVRFHQPALIMPNRLAVGRMTLNHQSVVRIYVRQPS